MEEYEPHVIEMHNANIVLIKSKKGFIMCGYLNIEVAEKLGDAAAIVTGVKTAQDALEAEVQACTEKAKQLGVKEGMSGKQALELMK